MGSRMLSKYKKETGSEDTYKTSLEYSDNTASKESTWKFFQDYTYGPVIDSFASVSEYCRSSTLLSYPWNIGSVYASAALHTATLLVTANILWETLHFFDPRAPHPNIKMGITLISWLGAPLTANFIKDSLIENTEHVVTFLSFFSFTAKTIKSPFLAHAIAIGGGIAYAHYSNNQKNNDLKELEETTFKITGNQKDLLKYFLQAKEHASDSKSNEENSNARDYFENQILVTNNVVPVHD